MIIFFALFNVCLIIVFFAYSPSGDESGKTSRIYKVFLPILFVAILFISLDLLVSEQFEELTYFASCSAVPLFLTCVNVVHLVQKRQSKTGLTDLTSILLGGFLWVMLVELSMDILMIPWYEPAYPNFYHEYLSQQYRDVILILLFAGIISIVSLSAFKIEKIPPMLSALLTAFTAVGLILFTLVNVQLMKNFQPLHLMLWVYVLNLYLIAARRVRLNIIAQVHKVRERQNVFRSRFGTRLNSLMSKFSGMTALSFLLILPVILVFEVIYIILGQGADGFIKAFTETADWTFSQQTPPPPVDYEGHYLCTVAAGGHRKVVKPLRYGVRRGERIVVNRQLLIANAFEDMIKERFPGFHRSVRSFYDKHGYPISRHITTQLRADIVYILMKPLELIFITALYLFDTEPENRIAVQYSEYKGRIG